MTTGQILGDIKKTLEIGSLLHVTINFLKKNPFSDSKQHSGNKRKPKYRAYRRNADVGRLMTNNNGVNVAKRVTYYTHTPTHIRFWVR